MRKLTPDELAFYLTRPFVDGSDIEVMTVSVIQAVMLADVCCVAKTGKPMVDDPIIQHMVTPMHTQFLLYHGAESRLFDTMRFDIEHHERTVSEKLTPDQRAVLRTVGKAVLRVDDAGKLKGKLLKVPEIATCPYGSVINKVEVAEYLKGDREYNELYDIFIKGIA